MSIDTSSIVHPQVEAALLFIRAGAPSSQAEVRDGDEGEDAGEYRTRPARCSGGSRLAGSCRRVLCGQCRAAAGRSAGWRPARRNRGSLSQTGRSRRAQLRREFPERVLLRWCPTQMATKEPFVMNICAFEMIVP